jgi:hypothetical protein
MKPTDEYKLGSLEEAEEFAKKRNQQLVEEAPYHPGYEDAVITPRSDPVYRGMDPAKMLWKSKPLSDEEIKELSELTSDPDPTDFVRAIERRHGIK